MSSPFTRLMTEEEELMFDAGQIDGRDRERIRIKEIIRQQLWLGSVITLGQWADLEEAIDNKKENE
jgi:hypothetical protein